MTKLSELSSQYESFKSRNLSLNLTRGKPSTDQIELSNDLDGVLEADYLAEDGSDTRNYGGLRGIPEARELGACLLDIPPERVIAGGNSSLHLMYIVVELLAHRGLVGPPLLRNSNAAAICPVPGYDRHFALTDYVGFKMINVAMQAEGPDMDAVEAMVRDDHNTCLLWCVPRHSNPTGYTYSDETVRRIAALPNLRRERSGSPFYVLWDNAYAVHDFKEPAPNLANLDKYAIELGTEDWIVQFASTSKITFAGAGVGFIGSSATLLADFERHLGMRTVGFDKVNQLRQARFLQNGTGLKMHMKKQAAIVGPKFEIAQKVLAQELGSFDPQIASWTHPTGGYFISLDVTPGNAKRVVETAKEAGLALTPAGATFPYGRDPSDANIRIAPTFANIEEVQVAMELLTTCVKLVHASK
ncbi:MAG: aminotransferase class I/II-fold pyridoxal phosphate-dependent enzyme [Gammaproteobacteria bacterium]|nr:aminotransferase class I/II-fold pyridoxal phosphate-dependent enzyme [Gammaproteobacteria bacterium]MYF37481.1 aminotransferase class I/II-fold pyridoxal phosphate-dependent enzyme [Gammaproteobacteria bacterium]